MIAAVAVTPDMLANAVASIADHANTAPLRFYAANAAQERWARTNLVGGIEIVRVQPIGVSA